MKEPFKYVFLITVDCLRADHVGCIGDTDLTPSIDKLARDGIVFTRAFANGPGTNQSFPAILTSTYFFIHGGLRLNQGCTTLAEVLSKHGFRTAAFHSNPFLSKTFGWDQGFHEFYDFMNVIKAPSATVTRLQRGRLVNRLARIALRMLGASYSRKIQQLLKKIYYRFSRIEKPYVDGKELNQHVTNWIEKHKNEKFFLWIHYMDPHEPYVPPEEYLNRFSSCKEALEFNLSVNMNNPSGEDLIILRELYEGEVRYVDSCIAELINGIENRGLLEDSLIIITADHGHAFMEHGRFGHAYDILYNEVIHIPLIIYGIGKGKTSNKVQLLDLPPTILDILRINSPVSFIGESIFKEEKDSSTIFSESAKPDLINLKYDLSKRVISCIKGTYKLILNELDQTVELYDMENDFNERRNLFYSKEEKIKQLLSLVYKHLKDNEKYKMRIKLNLKRLKL